MVTQQNEVISSATTQTEGHGCKVFRQVRVWKAPEDVQQEWKGLSCFVVVERTGKRKNRHFKEQQYYISSQELSAQQLLGDIQGHWGIENRLHWVRDVTFSEDFPARRGGNAPVNWAILHNFFINIARSIGYRTIPQAQRCLSNQLHQIFSFLVGNHLQYSAQAYPVISR